MGEHDKIESLSQFGYALHDVAELARDEQADLKSEVDKNMLIKGVSAIEQAKSANTWFTTPFVRKAFLAWSEALNREQIIRWLSPYELEDTPTKKVGVIMAGNIPLVGLHDALSVLVTGNTLYAKLSSKDSILMTWVLELLSSISTEWKKNIQITDQLKGIDVLIATGSDNSARYFDYYFRDKNKLIRKNRTSIAIIQGEESKEDLKGLSRDVFEYFGMGCRNVTKVYLPKGYDLDRLFEAFYEHKELINHNKYANNYDYNKAVYLLNKIDLLENGFLLLKEDEGLHSPIAVLFYEYYDNLNQLLEKINESKGEIQCKVGTMDEEGYVSFGMTQQPELWDYADGVDTLKFLVES